MKTLQECNWKEYEVGNILDVRTTKHSIQQEMSNGDVPFVTRSGVNNGISGFVLQDEEHLCKGKCITIGAEGAIAFYQESPFIPGVKVYTLSHKKINRYTAAFLCTLLNQQVSRYSYGYARIIKKIVREHIFLPSTPDNTPDWQFMEDYMREVESKLLAQARPALQEKVNKYANLQLPTLNSQNWKEFAITDIFSISSGVRLTAANMHKGDTPFIGATDSNNGITAWVSNSNSSLDENVLGVNYNGSVCETFYHPYKCLFSDDVKRLHLKRQPADTMGKNSDDKYIYLFLKQIILQQKVKYAYGYKFKAERMSKQIILLPTTPDDTPDWQFMEDYMRAVEAKQIAVYLQQKHLA